MTVIAIDIDDTLYSFQSQAREIFVDLALERGDKRYQRGAYCAWGEWRSPVDVTDDDIWPKVIKHCHSDDNIIAQVPFPNAVEVLQDLANEGYQLHYISNRDPKAYAATYGWLNRHHFPIYGDHNLTCTTDDKIGQLKHCQYLIDDRPKTLVQFVYDFHWKHKYGSENREMERKAFGLYMPYNAALTDVSGIKLAPTWKLLRQYLIEQNVLRSLDGIAAVNGRR